MSDQTQQNEQTTRMQHLEAEVKRLTREKALLETKNEDLTKALRLASADRDRSEALLNMAMEWRGQVIEKVNALSAKLDAMMVEAVTRAEPKKTKR